LEIALLRLHPWATRRPHGPKLMVILILVLLGTFCMVILSVAIWSITYFALGIFDTGEAALYFSLVSFTTLGFGDDLLPREWRLLGGFTAANGFFAFGLITALLVETMRSIRLRQRDSLS
ncbi:MAG: ion channel, partial [Pseudomonadota bacterium]